MLLKSLISISNNKINIFKSSLFQNKSNNDQNEFKNQITTKSSNIFFTRPNFVNY
ncbi:hypothetical protein DDB_G0282383 [Dictyostelium discoideum AX4]|uniref:Uncharacterized protein n=1 Tax=Dictyostelium discoideum TaxID=44689 RepID=Q54SM2_DICDI|nr:hypothetical protein DDB_G0282383 [Dictyostelium discoideum AX4]EAL66051.1 hypothetical protein DDB_G0282383 [Dictyostelium discoideum AX4]|eukprot:XP_640017.1 hypothetical protein DDB_G0282383 [Dictyostelium discoideum AX4]